MIYQEGITFLLMGLLRSTRNDTNKLGTSHFVCHCELAWQSRTEELNLAPF